MIFFHFPQKDLFEDMHGGVRMGHASADKPFSEGELLMLMYAQSHILVNPSQYHHNVVVVAE